MNDGDEANYKSGDTTWYRDDKVIPRYQANLYLKNDEDKIYG